MPPSPQPSWGSLTSLSPVHTVCYFKYLVFFPQKDGKFSRKGILTILALSTSFHTAPPKKQGFNIQQI